MGSVRHSSHDPRCDHTQLPLAALEQDGRSRHALLCNCGSRVASQLAALMSCSCHFSEQQVGLPAMAFLWRHWLWREEGTDGVIMPLATLTSLSEPPASSNSALALSPHKWVFCLSGIGTNFPVANTIGMLSAVCAPKFSKAQVLCSHATLKHLKIEFYNLPSDNWMVPV